MEYFPAHRCLTCGRLSRRLRLYGFKGPHSKIQQSRPSLYLVSDCPAVERDMGKGSLYRRASELSERLGAPWPLCPSSFLRVTLLLLRLQHPNYKRSLAEPFL